jgi:hypothetical protein
MNTVATGDTGGVLMLARGDLRRRWRSAVASAVLVGLVGAIVFATAAGARRSGTALDRFNTFSRSSDLEVNARATAAQLRALERVPEVAGLAHLHAYALTLVGRPDVGVAAQLDDRLGRVVDRARLITGRRPDPRAVDETTIGEALASQQHLKIGSIMTGSSLLPSQMQAAFEGRDPGPPRGPNVRLRVVGIVRRPLDLGDRALSGGVVVLTPAFDRAYRNRVAVFSSVLRIRVRHGAPDVPRAVAAARRIFGNDPFFEATDLTAENRGAHDAINVLTVALWIFAGVAAAAGAVTIAIVLTRDAAQVSDDQSTLRALGLTHRDRFAATLPRAAVIAFGGAVLATAGAIAASPLFPVGLARRADVDVGLHADWTVLAIGIAATVLLVASVTTIAGFRATRVYAAAETARARALAPAIIDAASGAGLRPTVTNGLRMALQRGRGRTAVPVRSAFLGAIAGIVGITGVLVFSSSLDHLAATPRLYGWTWDFKAPDDTFSTPCGTRDFGVAREPGVTAVGSVCYQPAQVNARPVTAWGFRSLRGTVTPEILGGRAPRAANEVALGSITLRAIHKGIGDTVRIQGGTKPPRDYRVVGRAVFPRLTNGDVQPLADGAAFTGAGLTQILDTTNANRFVVGRFAPRVDRAAVVRRIDTIPAFHPAPANQTFANDSGVGLPAPPPEIVRVRRIDWFPPTLALLLALLAFVAVGHALVTSVRRHRRDLALLKTLGFRRRQVRATVAWSATTLAVVGLVVGIPVGVWLGRLAWRTVADGLGVSAVVTVPTLALLLTIPAALLFVNVVGLVPARAAARTRPALALRTE